MNTKNFVGKLNMITIKMMGKEFILSLMCFTDIIQTYGDHSLLFSKELFFQVQYVQIMWKDLWKFLCATNVNIFLL